MSAYRSILIGSAWAIGMRWADLGIGFVSTVILARLLTPEDFGIVAMATLVSGLLNSLSNLGIEQLLIRERRVTRAYFDCAWSVTLARSLLIAIILYSAAPLAVLYFDEPRVEAVMRWIALGAAISGFQNIRIVELRKRLHFDKDFYFRVVNRIFLFAITVPLAFYLRNYWSLVIGFVAGSLFGVVHGYLWVPHRPRVSIRHLREVLRFTLVVTPMSIAGYLTQKVDVLVVSSIGTTAQLGAYNVSAELSQMPTGEVIRPLGRVLLPVYSSLSQKPEELREVFLNVLKTTAILCVSLGLGLSLVAEPVVLIIFGEQWRDAIGFIEWLAVGAAITGLTQPLTGQILFAVSREKLSLVLGLIRLGLLASAVTVAGRLFGIEAVAPAVTATAGVYLVIAVAIVRSLLGVSWREVMLAFFPSLAAGALMYLAVRLVQAELPAGLFVGLVTQVSAGALVYVTAILVLWVLLGRQKGPESGTIDYLRKLVRKPARP